QHQRRTSGKNKSRMDRHPHRYRRVRSVRQRHRNIANTTLRHIALPPQKTPGQRAHAKTNEKTVRACLRRVPEECHPERSRRTSRTARPYLPTTNSSLRATNAVRHVIDSDQLRQVIVDTTAIAGYVLCTAEDRDIKQLKDRAGIQLVAVYPSSSFDGQIDT